MMKGKNILISVGIATTLAVSGERGSDFRTG